MIYGLTDIAGVKDFWPSVLDEFPAAQLDSQLAKYILRADLLLNSLGTLNNGTPENVASLQMGANLLVQRLVLADKHPASAADGAGVIGESVQGLSWSTGRIRSSRSAREIVGDEVYVIVSSCLPAGSTIMKQDQQVFGPPVITTTDEEGNRVDLFDPRLDDNLDHILSEKLGIGQDPWKQGNV